MFDQQGWKVNTVVNDPDAEIIRLRELLNASEARERRLREACEFALAYLENDWSVDEAEQALRAALAEETDDV